MAFVKYATLLVVLAAISVLVFPAQNVTAAEPIDISSVDNFALLAETYTDAGAGTVLDGDVGFNVGTSPPPSAEITGVEYAGTDTIYTEAQTTRANLIAAANSQDCQYTIDAVGGTVLDTDQSSGGAPGEFTPGVYCINGGAASINESIKLNGAGVYIFRIGGALDAVENAVVTLEGADANNVFWVPTGAISLGINSVFKGNLLPDGAHETTLGSGATLDGRILSADAVTTNGLNTITASPWSLPVLPVVPVVVQPSDDCEDCVPPTLGLTANSVRMVDQGFSYNGKSTNVQLFTTPLPLITTNVGDVNTAVFKIYEDGGPSEVRHLDFIFGLASGQTLGQSKALIEWSQTWDGIETLNIIDPERALKDVRVETSEGPCKAQAVVKNDCLIVTIYHTFTAPLEFNIIATNVWDEHRNSWHNYFTPGIKIIDESTCTVSFPSGTVDLGSNAKYPNRTYPPGVYCIDGTANIGSGPIILSGNGAHIFKINGALNQAANTDVILANGAKASDIIWVPTGATTIGANSHLIGTVTSAPITIGANADLNGVGSVKILAGTISDQSPCTVTFPRGAVDLGSNAQYPNKTYPPGVYCIDGTANIGSGPIILSGSGAHIFKINGALNQAANTNVILANGAEASGVIWIPSGATTIGANSHLIGAIAGAPITIGFNSDLSGMGPTKIPVIVSSIIYPCTVSFPSGTVDLGSNAQYPNRTYPPGVYCIDGTANIGSGPIILSGNGAHIFKINGALNQAANTDVILANGALAADVIWVPTGATTIGANSHLIGAITGAPITIGANSALNGMGPTKITANTVPSSSTCTVSFPRGTVDLGSNAQYPNRTYPPGVYCIDGTANIGSGPIILSGNGAHIFKINGALNQAANTDVILANGALVSGVFWMPTGATTIGTNSHLIGTLVGAPITIGANSDFNGMGPVKITADIIKVVPDTIIVPDPDEKIITPPPAKDELTDIVILSSLQQYNAGVYIGDIKCDSHLVLMMKSEVRTPACVTPATKIILIERGWGLEAPPPTSLGSP